VVIVLALEGFGPNHIPISFNASPRPLDGVTRSLLGLDLDALLRLMTAAPVTNFVEPGNQAQPQTSGDCIETLTPGRGQHQPHQQDDTDQDDQPSDETFCHHQEHRC
jgi:hypothetical protein